MEAEWTPKPVSAFWRRQKSLLLLVAHKNIRHYRDHYTNWTVPAFVLSQWDLAYRSSWYTTPPRKLCSKGICPSFVRNVGVCLRNYTASCPRRQLVKSSNLRQMNSVRFHISVQLVKSSNSTDDWCPFSPVRSSCEIIESQTDELCPFSPVRSSCETIESQTDESCPFTHMSWRPILLFFSHFPPHLRSSVDVFTFPHSRGLLYCALPSCHLFRRLKEIQKRGNAVLMRQLLRHIYCAYSLNNTLQALT